MQRLFCVLEKVTRNEFRVVGGVLTLKKELLDISRQKLD